MPAVMSDLSPAGRRSCWCFPPTTISTPGIIDAMVAKGEQGIDVVCASRFIPGGCMEGCRWLKPCWFAPRHSRFIMSPGCRPDDADEWVPPVSRRVIDRIAIESDSGFCYSLEMLVKSHRLGWPVADVPANGSSASKASVRFQVMKWCRPICAGMATPRRPAAEPMGFYQHFQAVAEAAVGFDRDAVDHPP